jgi:hypothetical protein
LIFAAELRRSQHGSPALRAGISFPARVHQRAFKPVGTVRNLRGDNTMSRRQKPSSPSDRHLPTCPRCRAQVGPTDSSNRTGRHRRDSEGSRGRAPCRLVDAHGRIVLTWPRPRQSNWPLATLCHSPDAGWYPLSRNSSGASP